MGAVNTLSAELRSQKTRRLAVHLLSAYFAAGSRNSRKNLCCLLKIDSASVIDDNENEHTRRRYAVVFFCFDHEIYDDIYHCLTDINATLIIYHKFLCIIVRKRLPAAFVSLFSCRFRAVD